MDTVIVLRGPGKHVVAGSPQIPKVRQVIGVGGIDDRESRRTADTRQVDVSGGCSNRSYPARGVHW